MTHTDLNRTVMYNGMICRIIGVTYSHTEYKCTGRKFYSYHLMPEGKLSLKDSIQYQTFDKLAFEPPVMGGADTAISPQLSDKSITIYDAPYLELVKG